MDRGWIRPLEQVAYQVTGETFRDEAEYELPPPANQRGRSPSFGPEEFPHGAYPGEVYPDGGWSDGEWIGTPQGGPCCGGPDCGCAGGCGSMCGDGVSCGCGPGCNCGGESYCIDLAFGLHDPEACEEVRFRVPKIQELVVYGGVHGFKGPYDGGRFHADRDGGNFGFQEGINIGAKVPLMDVGYQLGFQATQSQLSGDADANISDPFSQYFFTAGGFHRTRDGFQGGAVWDLVLDDRDTTVSFAQLRAELSFVDRGCHELGAMLAVHLGDEVFNDDDVHTFQATDQYLLFYRMHGQRGGEGRVFGGVTDDSDGIVGADFLLPLHRSWSLQSEFTYLIPEERGGSLGAQQEAWNLAINLVWHWKGHARKCHSNPYRPLFNVADNGSLVIDDRP